MEAFGLFKKGIKPEWEDPVNVHVRSVWVGVGLCVWAKSVRAPVDIGGFIRSNI